MQNANILTFLQENLQRLFTKSPTFFKVWMAISGALVLVTGLPEFINMLHINGINIPDLLNAKSNLIVSWASRGVFFMSLLTTQSKPTAVTNDGTVVKVTDTKKLPFTAAKEQKAAVKKDVPVIQNIVSK